MKAQIISIVPNEYNGNQYLNIPVVFPESGRTLTLSCNRKTFQKLNGNIPDDQIKKQYWDINYVTVTRKSNRTGNSYTQNILLDLNPIK